MARKPPDKLSPKGRGKPRKGEDLELSRGRAVPPPPAGLEVMPLPFGVDDIREDGKSTLEITATATECAAIAQEYDLPALESLSARLSLSRRGPMVHVWGTLKARLTQICVVSLDPFESAIEEGIERDYAPAAQVLAAWEEVARLEAAGSPDPIPDPPDQINEGKIDLGALVSESLALALDPYPKKPGVEFAAPEMPEASPDESPFAVLARLKGENGPKGGA